MYPFDNDLASIVIAKYKEFDSFVVATRIKMTKPIQNKWKTLDTDQKNEIRQYFENVYFKHDQNLQVTDEFNLLGRSRIFLIQNLWEQELLNAIQDDVVMMTEVVRILKVMDSSLTISKNKTKYDMFQ